MYFMGAGSGDDRPVKYEEDSREQAAGADPESVLQIPAGVRVSRIKRELGPGQDHRFVQARQHGKECGGCVRHGVRAVAEDDPVRLGELFIYPAGHQLPVMRLDVGAVQGEELFCLKLAEVFYPRDMPQQICRVEAGC